ncbi:MAG: tyrosine-type recombinase/integrase [Lachnospiraceae bacterium]|nr:tyrosine-type recombinase/integrase [bacterium]MDY5517781.1 tyrosine-type recombinase/integrase [Lachnospiraceae bacterium]
MKRPKGDEICWSFPETDPDKPWKKNYRFDFSYIHSVALRKELQDYIWGCYRNGDKKLATLRQEHSWFKYYEAWLSDRGITSLARVRRVDVEGFLTYLHTCISKKTGRQLRLITQKHIYDTARGIHLWHAVHKETYADSLRAFPSDVYQKINRITPLEAASRDDVARFLQCLEQTDNPCLRCGGRILAETGLSAGDLLDLRKDCIHTDHTGAHLRYYHHRKRRYCVIPVSQACVRAVQTLIGQTEALRSGAEQHLFLYFDKRMQVCTPSPDVFRYWMRCAQRAGGGEHADALQEAAAACNMPHEDLMTATRLRQALFYDMWEQKVPYMVIRELAGVPLFSERGSIV